MIQGFGCKYTEVAFVGNKKLPKKVLWKNLLNIVLRKLDMLDYAETLSDLRSPPGNRLEPLKGDLLGYHSIRINDQYRIIFIWTKNGPDEVQVIDYHK